METECGFEEFSSDELDAGYNWAIDKCGIRVDYGVLRKVGNHAGAIRKAKQCLPRVAATKALRAYERGNYPLPAAKFQAYVRSIAKMMNERKNRELRRRERELAEIKAAS